MKQISSKLGILLFGGSIPERSEDGKLYNTSLVFDDKGEIVGKYRKIHLFDIDIPGKSTYKESDIFSAGSQACLVNTKFGKFGVGICYDIRFPELSLALCKNGAQVMIYPGNFSYHTGELHWELLLKARALDTQCYVVGASAARFFENKDIYQTWAHSAIVDPMAKLLAGAGEQPEIIYADIDLEYVSRIRQQIPNQMQKRPDVYKSI